MPINLNIKDETGDLDLVILGIAEDISGPLAREPKEKFHLTHHSYPAQEDIALEINSFEKALIQQGIKVLRPQNRKNLTQIFVRDLGFVIDDEFYLSSLSSSRNQEKKGIEYIVELFDPAKVNDVSRDPAIQIEGGDVVLWKDNVFVGLSDRTNQAGYEYLRHKLSGKKNVQQLKLVIDNEDHRNHVLHLDCSFQPLGANHAIVYEKGIKNVRDLYAVLDLPEDNIFKADEGQFVCMFPNIFSLSEKTVVIEKEFIELRYWLQERGFHVVEVRFREISKLGGLLRCATLPLVRGRKNT